MMYLVVELKKNEMPKIIGLFRSKEKAEEKAYSEHSAWRNVIELKVQ